MGAGRNADPTYGGIRGLSRFERIGAGREMEAGWNADPTYGGIHGLNACLPVARDLLAVYEASSFSSTAV
jgi:hypothetical protein